MTGTLNDIFESRAARADADADAVLDAVRAGAARRVRRQRNLAAAGTGAVLVAALAVGVAVLSPGHDPDLDGPTVPAGGGPTTATTTPSATPTVTPSALGPVAPAPTSAEVSISLVPDGWVLLDVRGPVTVYGPPSLAGRSDGFEGKLVVSVGERYASSKHYPLTIAGRPGDYFDKTTPGTYQGVDVIVDATTEVNIQLPDTLTLGRTDVLRLANTLDVRRTTEKTHG